MSYGKIILLEKYQIEIRRFSYGRENRFSISIRSLVNEKAGIFRLISEFQIEVWLLISENNYTGYNWKLLPRYKEITSCVIQIRLNKRIEIVEGLAFRQ